MAKSLFVLLLLFLLLLNVDCKLATAIKTSPRPFKTHLTQKLSHLHFYYQEVVSGPKPTAIPVTKPLDNTTLFGMITVIDNRLTQGPSPNSTELGRAQGMHAGSAQGEAGLLMAMNLYFTEGKYNGSVLTILGRNPVMHPVREMPVVGGSGLFRFATGFALVKTYFFDSEKGDAVVEYNVTVMHY
ncbi:uncharacterized protein A4U43_C02F6800 [Asparagus officinalis]|uniref:Dirigent protein n=1 Tax=Asparagus officinalis TaxID=4686 RepID=A0A5P1FGG3_ASPOF|nr:uncharacterized protein A4U43_C02F6800 [Asparagus officinalis]